MDTRNATVIKLYPEDAGQPVRKSSVSFGSDYNRVLPIEADVRLDDGTEEKVWLGLITKKVGISVGSRLVLRWARTSGELWAIDKLAF